MFDVGHWRFPKPLGADDGSQTNGPLSWHRSMVAAAAVDPVVDLVAVVYHSLSISCTAYPPVYVVGKYALGLLYDQ